MWVVGFLLCIAVVLLPVMARAEDTDRNAKVQTDDAKPGRLPVVSSPFSIGADPAPRYPYPSLKELEARLTSAYDVRIKRLENEEARLKSSLLHQVRISASAGMTQGETVFISEGAGLTSGRANAGVGLSLSVPLTAILPGVRAPGDVELERRELEFAKLIRDKVRDLRGLYNEREMAVLATQLAEADIRLAEVRYDKAKVAYSIQEGDKVEVVAAQRGLIEARLRFVEAENKIFVLESRIASLLGEPYEFPGHRAEGFRDAAGR